MTERAHETIVRLERVLSSLKDLETGQRGFLLTGEEPYLEPYDGGLAAPRAGVQALDGLDVDTVQLRRLVAEREDAAARAIAQFRTSGTASVVATMRTGVGKRAMDRVRRFVADAQARADATIDAQAEHDRTLPSSGRDPGACGSTLGAIALIAWLAAKRRKSRGPRTRCSKACWATPRWGSASSTRACTSAT